MMEGGGEGGKGGEGMMGMVFGVLGGRGRRGKEERGIEVWEEERGWIWLSLEPEP